jgi:hypothetical protein
MNSLELLPPEQSAFDRLIDLEPKPVKFFVPLDGDEQKSLFMAGDIINPDHTYDGIDYEQQVADIKLAGDQLLNSVDNPKFLQIYKEYTQNYLQIAQLINLAHIYKTAETVAERDEAKKNYLQMNCERYGEPSEATYRSLFAEKLHTIASLTLAGRANQLRNELFQISGYEPGDTPAERFKPSAETVEWMSNVVNSLYGGMLDHVPDQPTFDRQEVVTIFDAILREEFGGSADDWSVIVEKAASVNVRSSSKQIVIPEKQKSVTQEKLKGLIVHEIGVHALRAIMGGQTDLLPLSTGLSKYYESEEGLGMVMEQARKGTFIESGVMHYISIGGAYYDNKNFRDLYEQRWRFEALAKVTDGKELTDEIITAAKNAAYSGTMRTMRGTDDLPWFKDLAYFNGAVSIWKHLESIRGDDIKFVFVLMGKSDPTNIDHERVMYETST